MRILVFDNYDSFTYNLVHLVEKITHGRVDVFRNDEIGLEEVKKYDKIILSPGPGIPSEAGLLLPLIKEYAPTKSILGVCLGHQAIGQAFGGTLVNLTHVYHGVATPIHIAEAASSKNQAASFKPQAASSELPTNSLLPTPNSLLFFSLPSTFPVGRYHSWVVGEEGFPDVLEVTAWDDNDYIMGLQHKTFDVQGVQFHPESVLTPDGETIMRNWLKQ